jgi:ribosome maturation factor RimP
LEAKIKGNTVRVGPKYPLPAGYERTGKVIAETETTVAVKFEGKDVPVIIRKPYVAVVATPIKDVLP